VVEERLGWRSRRLRRQDVVGHLLERRPGNTVAEPLQAASQQVGLVWIVTGDVVQFDDHVIAEIVRPPAILAPLVAPPGGHRSAGWW
jgi:hypothetical protein